ncbi:MAG: ASKHA domain-containing protein [Dissulfuribacterales bacterium]|uniref:ASKHA domain-containing protein n=1 Tax=Desulfosarcina sp. BuS5 TaxID=933262 RepID=UPI00048137FC|nr:ASKHA domain-containing protein [Desulfosarcina sp. BuS5]WDN89644.1 hypothetical protein BuS5_02612 [Desulfosarcina sp. BuS5]
MSSFKVKFLPHNKEIIVSDGRKLIRAAMEAGVHINASCGGEGLCGKCRVLLEEGELEGGISEKLSREDIENGYRLACQSKVRSDLVIRIPTESTIDARVLNLQSTPRKTARIRKIDFNQLKEEGLFIPPVEKIYLELTEPDAQDHLPDVTRLVSFLKLQHDEHRLVVDMKVIRRISDIFREGGFKVTATLMRPVQEGRKTHIVNIHSGDTSGCHYAIAIDVGTTTIYGQLIDLINGKTISQYGEFNGQISYGEDVISRIVYAEKPGGLEKLQKVVIGSINKVINRVVKRADIDKDCISTITMAGNTTMTQLMLNVNPKYIRRSPYVPTSSIYPPIRASDLGIDLGEQVAALVYPQVSSYVGGDIVSGVMGSGMYRTDKLTLFMDIGTNAEIVIGNREWMACAACSAGPAFEGGGIEFGMRATKGAIEDFSIDPVSYEPMNITIGNVRPRGICGSGLIIMVATLFEMGLINNLGKFDRDLDTQRIRERNGVHEYVLAWKDDTGIDRDVVITEIDIENLMRAKGAIYSGCQTLVEEVGMSMADIEQIYLAGGFGSYVDIEKAIVIGLLPEIEHEKITFIGNGSLMGAKMAALTNRIRKDVVEVTSKMTNFELSETVSYMDNYMAALFLPHTDMEQFPKLKARLEARVQSRR